MNYAFLVVALAAAALGSATGFVPAPDFLMSEAAAQTGGASVDNVKLVLGSTTLRFKRVETHGGSTTGAELETLFDASGSAPEKFARLSAETVVIPELDVETQAGGATQRFTYRDVVLTGVGGGKAREVSAEGASFILSNPVQGEARGAYGRMSAKDVDLVLLARIAASDKTEEPKAPLYRDLSVEGVHFEAATIGFDAEKIAVGAAWGAPPGPAAPAPPQDATPEAREKAAQADAMRWLGAHRIENVEIDNPALTLRSGDTPLVTTAASVSMSSFDNLRVAALSARSVVFARETGDVSVASARLEGVDLAALLQKGAFASDAALASPVFARFVLSGVGCKSADGERQVLSIRGVDVRNAELSGEAGAKLDVTLDGLDAPLGASALPALASLGYDRLDLSGRFSASWRSGPRELAISDFSLEGAHIGQLKLSALLGGVSAALASPDQEKASSAARNVVLKTLDVTFVNEGVVDKALAAQAERQKTSVDEARQSAMTQASLILPALMGNAPPLRLIGSEAARFIADPNNFNLVARSPQGVGLRDFELVATPAALLKRVEITAYANR
ncbi:hypothetical protein [Methylocella sp.]|uniref:hypothetical protein n=1 Tax=Methylocella sp. TaxID=1978226 RepID=UPI0037852C34